VITDPRIGSEVAGYRIESLIGRGGMSVVYLAEDVHLKRKVALKLLAPELGQSEKFQERFVRESQLAASLDHPNIIPIFGAGEVGGLLYLAMRFVEGTDLKTLIVGEGALAPDRTIRLVTQAGSALDTAHARGLIHRDVKPANMLIASGASVGGQEHLYLSDFGLTKRSSSDSGITGTGQFVGTLDYAAPEQFEGKPLDARTDVYSLGGVLYECLTAEAPYHRDNEAALVYAHLMASPPSVTEKRPELSDAINAVVAKAMAKAPEQRFESAGALVEAARRVLVPDRPTEVIDQGPTPPAGSKVGARRAVVLAAGALVVIAAVVTGLLLGRGGKGAPGSPSTSPSPVGLAVSDRVARISQAGSAHWLGKLTPLRAGKDPRAVAVGEGSVWVANEGDGTVARIDPVTNQAKIIKVGNQPDAIAYGLGSIWVANRLSHSVTRIDPGANKVVATIDLNGAGFPSSIAVGESAIWVGVDGDYPLGNHAPSVEKIDPQSNQDVASLPVQGELLWVVVTADGGSVWAAGNGGHLLRIDEATNQVQEMARLSIAAGAITVADGSVWIATPQGEIVRVDPKTGKIQARVFGGGALVDCSTGNCSSDNATLGISAGDGIVCVTNKADGSISRVVTAGTTALRDISTGLTPTGVAFGYGSVWVTVDSTT
jgi:streptogramin lyase/tRNA A-37 threonylcarbamoyl transferase component Bud32